MKRKYPFVDEVMRWPEFVAFSKRLGIDITRPTSRLVIDLSEGRLVEISHEFQGEDCGGEE